MSEAVQQWGVVAVAGLAAVWAGLFALARQSQLVSGVLGDPPEVRKRAVPTGQAMQMCHSALLVFSGAAAGQALEWWSLSPASAAARLLLTLALLYVLASGIPHAIGVLLPKTADAAASVARRSLAPFSPLLGLISVLEVPMHARFPAPSRATDRFGREHHDMLDGVFSLGDATVEEAMTPRLDVEALNAAARWPEVVEQLRRSDHATLPVYEEDLDTITGIIYAKDLTPAVAGLERIPDNWQNFKRPALFVPESKTLTAQLRDFQRGPSKFAIVVDEFGGTSGVVTLEDVLEEVVGEIHGEYDVDVTPPVEREGDDRFWVDGSYPVDDLSELLGKSLEREDVTTVGGLVYAELGHVPQPGEELRVEGFRVVVEQVLQRRIKRVYFERLATEEDQDLPSGSVQ